MQATENFSRFDSRGIYRPPGAIKVTDKPSGAWAYIYTDGRGRPCARTFTASKQRLKPVSAYSFQTPANRDKHVADFFAGQRVRLQQKAEAKAKAAAPHDVKVGDLFYTSWGYEQTNVDFYQVLDVKGHRVLLNEIGSRMESNEGGSSMSGREFPIRDQFKGAPFWKRVSMYAGAPQIKIEHRRYASRTREEEGHYSSWYG